MPDISMCMNRNCPLSRTCYRFIAKPCKYRQAYSDFNYSYDTENNISCSYYWSTEEKMDE